MDKVIKNKYVAALSKAVKEDPYDALLFAGTLYIVATIIVLGFFL